MKTRFVFSAEVLTAGALTLAGSLACYLLWQHNPVIAGENELMESLQAILLGLALLFCLGRAVSGKFKNSGLPLGFLILFFLTFLLREVDFERSSLPHWLIFLASGRGRNALLGMGWLGYAVFFLRHRASWWPEFLRYFTSRAGIYFLLALALYVCGYPFDKEIFSLSKPQHRFFEELLELVASFFFLVAAWLSIRAAQKGGVTRGG